MISEKYVDVLTGKVTTEAPAGGDEHCLKYNFDMLDLIYRKATEARCNTWQQLHVDCTISDTSHL